MAAGEQTPLQWLSERADELEDEAEDLERQIEEMSSVARKLRSAAAALRGPDKKRSHRSSRYTPKPENLQKVRDIFATLEPGATLKASEVQARCDLSEPTVRGALQELRKREEIRVAGQNGHGVLWAKMP
jgi:Fic family protein